MELTRESKRIKKLRDEAKKKLNQKQDIMDRADKAEADKQQTKLMVFL